MTTTNDLATSARRLLNEAGDLLRIASEPARYTSAAWEHMLEAWHEEKHKCERMLAWLPSSSDLTGDNPQSARAPSDDDDVEILAARLHSVWCVGYDGKSMEWNDVVKQGKRAWRDVARVVLDGYPELHRLHAPCHRAAAGVTTTNGLAPFSTRPWIFSKRYGIYSVTSQEGMVLLGSDTCKKLGAPLCQHIVDAVNAYDTPLKFDVASCEEDIEPLPCVCGEPPTQEFDGFTIRNQWFCGPCGVTGSRADDAKTGIRQWNEKITKLRALLRREP